MPALLWIIFGLYLGAFLYDAGFKWTALAVAVLSIAVPVIGIPALIILF